MPFKLHSKGRRHIPRQRHRVTNGREYDVCLRNRGNLHSGLRACGLPVQTTPRNKTGDLYLIVDSTGLKLRGAGEWLFEKHRTAKRRAWRKLHIGVDAGSGEIVAFDLTNKDVDDASHVETLLEQLDEAPASFMAMALIGLPFSTSFWPETQAPDLSFLRAKGP
jgi:hypothetical protein